jgi:hypothetical protein
MVIFGCIRKYNYYMSVKLDAQKVGEDKKITK